MAGVTTQKLIAEAPAPRSLVWEAMIKAGSLVTRVAAGQRATSFMTKETDEGLVVRKEGYLDTLVIDYKGEGKTVRTFRFMPPVLAHEGGRLVVQKFEFGKTDPSDKPYTRSIRDASPEDVKLLTELSDGPTILSNDTFDTIPAHPLGNVIESIDLVSEELHQPLPRAPRIERIIGWLNRG